jgi:type IV fimbrial biogenesis protein FimT
MKRQYFNNINKIKGFSLIELMIVITILGLLLALAMPNFADTIESANTNSQIKVMMTTLNLARSEAIKRGADVSICATDDGLDCSADTWSDGWMVFVDNNGDADGDAGSVDAGDIIIRVYDSLGAGSTMTFTVDLLSYNSLGFSATGGTQTFLLCPPTNNANNARSVVIGPSGRGRRVEDGLVCA